MRYTSVSQPRWKVLATPSRALVLRDGGREGECSPGWRHEVGGDFGLAEVERREFESHGVGRQPEPQGGGLPVEDVAHVVPDVPPVLVGCLAVGAGRHPADLGRVARRVGSEPDRGDAPGPRGRIGYVCLVEVGGGRDDLRPPHGDALGLVGDLRRGLSQADRAGTDHRYRGLPRWLPGSLPGVGGREGRDVSRRRWLRLEVAAARSGDRRGGTRTGG